MFHHRFSHLFHFRPLHYGATKKLGANQYDKLHQGIDAEELFARLFAKQREVAIA